MRRVGGIAEQGTAQEGPLQIGKAEIGASELHVRFEVGACQIGPDEGRPAKVNPGEEAAGVFVGAGKHLPGQGRRGEVHAVEVGATQARLLERGHGVINLAHVPAAQIGAGEVGAGQIRLRIRQGVGQVLPLELCAAQIGTPKISTGEQIGISCRNSKAQTDTAQIGATEIGVGKVRPIKQRAEVGSERL